MKTALVLLLITACYRGNDRRDAEISTRLARIENRLAIFERELHSALDRSDNAQLALLMAKLHDLQQKLDTIDQELENKPSPRAKRPEPNPALVYAVPIGSSPVVGSPKAKVTLVMTMEFDCPYCRRAFDTVDELRKKYGKELRVVYKPYVVHPKTARHAAHAACAAHRQGKWREMADLLWTRAFEQKGTDPDAFLPERIDELAKQLRIDMKLYERDVAGICTDETREEQAMLAQLGVSATPSFFINGRYMAGARPLDAFSSLIDEEMAKASAAIKAGVKPDKYYEQEVVAKGFTRAAAP